MKKYFISLFILLPSMLSCGDKEPKKATQKLKIDIFRIEKPSEFLIDLAGLIESGTIPQDKKRKQRLFKNLKQYISKAELDKINKQAEQYSNIMLNPSVWEKTAKEKLLPIYRSFYYAAKDAPSVVASFYFEAPEEGQQPILPSPDYIESTIEKKAGTYKEKVSSEHAR
jgi:hypothetical protein